MDIRAVAFVLGNLLLVVAVCLLAPLVISVGYAGENPNATAEIAGFAITFVVCVVLGLLGRYVLRASADRIRVREGFAIVVFSWLLAVGLGMLPYLISGACSSVTDAFFETMSGFTTTGASIFPTVEVIPRGVQFWRCMTQWLGGMGIVVLSVALLPMLGVGGYRMLKAESPGGVAFEREAPRITDIAQSLWRLYLVISAAQVVLLRISGMDWYNAFCHTFTTMSTGGFSPHTESVGYFSSPLTHWIIIVFMFVAGVNFSLYAQVLRGKVGPLLKNPEFRLYVGIFAAVIFVGLMVVPRVGDFESHLRNVSFQIVSIGTTTGFATDDFDAWPQLMRALLVCLMFIGGCMGSTGGGMKVARLMVFAKAVLREMNRPIFPHAVRHIRVGDKVLDPTLVSNILAFGALYACTWVVGTLVTTAYGYDLVTSLTASAAALGNIGPGLGDVGPSRNWAHFPDVVKWVMSLCMLVGRLELYSVFILLTPWAWRR